MSGHRSDPPTPPSGVTGPPPPPRSEVDPRSLSPAELRQAARVAQAVGETLVRAAAHTLKNVLNPLALQVELLRRRVSPEDTRSLEVLTSMRETLDAGDSTLDRLRTEAESNLQAQAPGVIDVGGAVALALDAAFIPHDAYRADAGTVPAVEVDIDERLELRVDGLSLLVALFEVFEASIQRRPRHLRVRGSPRQPNGVLLDVVHDGEREQPTDTGQLRAIAIARGLAALQRGSLRIEDRPDGGRMVLELPDLGR